MARHVHLFPHPHSEIAQVAPQLCLALQALVLRENRFSGPIDEAFMRLKPCSLLESLQLQDNHFDRVDAFLHTMRSMHPEALLDVLPNATVEVAVQGTCPTLLKPVHLGPEAATGSDGAVDAR